MKAALILWEKWGLNERADQSETTAIRKRWNGGDKGLEEVKAAYARARRLVLEVPKPPPLDTRATPAPAKPADPTGFWAALWRILNRR